ncbi:MAG: hypothetical protein R3F56_18830 [Planctomycetota bacterium]
MRGDVQNRAHEIGVKTVRLMEAGLDQWFLSGASVRTLLEQEWRPQLKLFRDQIEAEAKESLERSLQERDGGLDSDQAPQADLRQLGADVSAIRRRAAEEVLATPLPPVPKVKVDIDAIPIKRGMGDWAMLLDRPVRESLFGGEGGLDQKITAKQKAARLGEPGKRYLRDHLQAVHDAFCRDAAQQVIERMARQVATSTTTELRARVSERRQQLETRQRDLERQWNLCVQVLTPLRKMGQVVDEARSAVRTLAAQHNVDAQGAVEDTIVLPRPSSAPELTMPARSRSRRR